MTKRIVRDLPLQGKRVLLRADFNVPLRAGPDGTPEVANDTRIRGALPTVEYCIDQGASVVACSHLGRPKGKVDAALSLAPIAKHMGRLLSRPVQTVPDCVGPEVQSLVEALQPGQVLLLENLRFHAEEEANEAGFAARLAALADVYVNDAFGAAHRAHASTAGVAHLLPAAAGLLLARELEALGSVFADDAGIRAVVSGGAKVSTKLALLRSVVEHARVVCIGGAMANTFLLADGVDVADSLAEPEMVQQAREIRAAAAASGCELLLPLDAIVARNRDAPARARPIDLADEGPETTHFSVIDSTGMAVSNTYTLEQGFGSKVVVTGAGFLLNNEMGDFNWKPGLTNRRGRIGTPPNQIEPGKRMLSSQTPVIATRDGRVYMVTGSPGGRTIINTVLCVVLNVLEFGMDVRAAVDAPRMDHEWFPERVRFVDAENPKYTELVAKLREMGHDIQISHGQGDAHTILVKNGQYYGAADNRFGKASGY